MQNSEIIQVAYQILVGGGVLVLLLTSIFKGGKIVNKIEGLEVAIQALRAELKEEIKNVREDLKIVDRRIGNLEVQVGKVEARVEVRDLRVIHTGMEQKVIEKRMG